MGVENSWLNADFGALVPKNFRPELFPNPVKKEKINLDERPQSKRRVTPQNQGVVMAACRDGSFLSLNPRQRRILEARYLSESGPVSFRELGEEFGVSRERIRQVEHQTLERLKKSA